MEVRIDGLSKRFTGHWVFRDLTFRIPAGSHFAVTGPNGAGKSTLLKIIAGALPQSSGSLAWSVNGREIQADQLHAHVAFAAPYVSLIEELTLREAWSFHRKFRHWRSGFDAFPVFMETLQYGYDPDLPLQAMSSGMKQRLRLAFAVGTVSSLLILDEPTSNLDENGIQWFHELLPLIDPAVTVVIASNVREDLRSCGDSLSLRSGER